MCLGTPNRNTKDELEVPVLVDSCVPIALPSELNRDFAPRSSWQVSQVVRLSHCSAWRINFRIQVSCGFDVLHLHDLSVPMHGDQPSCSIRSATHTDAPAANQTHVANCSLAAIGATLAPVAVLTLENAPGGGSTLTSRL